MPEDKNNNTFDNLDKLSLTDVELNEIADCLGEKEGFNHEWHQRFAVDMDNPVKLTDIQKERALTIYNSTTAHMDAYPYDDMAPLICITQDWNVRVDFGGWVSDSDYRDSALCVMCRDDIGFYISLDYVEQCVPFIEKELREIATECNEMYGRVPDHQEDENRRVIEAEMKLLSILSDDTLKSNGLNNVLIAIDTIECSIYPVASDEKYEDYGGIIQYVPANTLLSNDGEIIIDNIKSLVNRLLR